jgi:MFS family permease
MTRGRQPVFYGWWVALTAALGLLFGVAPIFVFSFSVFLKAFTGEFHATRAAVSLAFTLHNLVSAFTAPFAGRLIDRFGSRRVILPTTVIFGLILLASSLIHAVALGNLPFLHGYRVLRMWFGARGLWKHRCTMV